ncbi:MAG: M14 family metallocarboxypeptidase [Verrucomicrobiota bacterium]
MDVTKYIEQLSQKIRNSAWKVEWMEKHSPYLYLPGPDSAPRLYLSTGIHGDEPAGPMVVLSMLEDNSFFRHLEVHLFPLLNPFGLAVGTRENGDGVDLNRNYGPHPVAARETERHIEILQSLPQMDVGICLHEDWEASGVYLYHLDSSMQRFQGRAVLDAMAHHLPVETACVIDGSNANDGVIARHESEYESEEWPESIFLCRTKTGASMTLETPSSAKLHQRMRAHQAGVAEVIRQLLR